MCGRYANTSSSKELQSFFDTMQTVGDDCATPAPDGQLGFAPCLGKDRKMASKLINARSETVTEIICPCQLRDSDFAPCELRVMRC